MIHPIALGVLPVRSSSGSEDKFVTLIPVRISQLPSTEMMLPQQDAEFTTIDGLRLRGRAYLAEQRGPGIVLSPGVSVLGKAVTIVVFIRT